MATIRNLFHEVGNWHNKISVIAGVTREMLTSQDITKLKAAELKEKISKVIKALNQIENNTIGADKTTDELKEFIYKKFDPNTEVSLTNKNQE
jgi:hypothetical protein